MLSISRWKLACLCAISDGVPARSLFVALIVSRRPIWLSALATVIPANVSSGSCVQPGELASSEYGNFEARFRTSASTRGRSCSGF